MTGLRMAPALGLAGLGACRAYGDPSEKAGNRGHFSAQSFTIGEANSELLRRLAEKNIPNCAGFSSGFKARGRRIVNDVTVIATQKLDDKDKQVGIFFSGNYLRHPTRNNLPTLLCLLSGFCVAMTVT